MLIQLFPGESGENPHNLSTADIFPPTEGALARDHLQIESSRKNEKSDQSFPRGLGGGERKSKRIPVYSRVFSRQLYLFCRAEQLL